MSKTPKKSKDRSIVKRDAARTRALAAVNTEPIDLYWKTREEAPASQTARVLRIGVFADRTSQPGRKRGKRAVKA